MRIPTSAFRFPHSYYLHNPPHGIFRLAVLNIGDCFIVFFSDRSRLVVVYGDHLIAIFNLTDWRDDSRGTGPENFFKAS